MEVIVGKVGPIKTKEIASKVELMIVIGSKKSANTNKLYNISLKECRNAMLVENIEDLYLNYVARFKKVGVAGTSTSQDMINKVVEILKNTQTKGYIYEHIK